MATTKKEKLIQVTHFTPAYDKRNSDPKKDYGIGAMRCFMLLKGKKGVVHFCFFTGILLESTVKKYIETGRAKYEKHEWGIHYLNKPMAMDVGYHSPKPLYDYQKEYGPRKGCEWLDGKPCYGDGSALQAEEWFNIFVEKGSDEIWKKLEDLYYETFYPKKK